MGSGNGREAAVIVLGSVNTDLVIRGPKLPAPGETVLGGTFFQAPGGKGANQAVAAARLGLTPAIFLAAVGGDSLGEMALANLKKENLNTEFVKTVKDVSTGVALILVDHSGQNCISVASGANLRLLPDDLDRVPIHVWQAARVFLASLEVPLATVIHGLTLARRHGLITILNPAPAAGGACQSEVMCLVDILTPNETEASELTGVHVIDEPSVIAAAKRLQAAGCGTVIVTRGEQGCTVVEKTDAALAEKTWSVPALPVTAIDTTAAGDAFNGALAEAIAEKKPLAAAIEFATRAAAYSVTRAGAQPSLPTRNEIAND